MRTLSIPYPLRSVRIALEIIPFGFWLIPEWKYRKTLTEAAKADGETIWWIRWTWFQISYGRWV